jgi:hypothetical protein
MSGWGEFHDYDFDPDYDEDARSMFADPGGESALGLRRRTTRATCRARPAAARTC